MLIGTAAVIVAFVCGVVFSDKVKAGIAKLTGDAEASLKAEVVKVEAKIKGQ
jgi:hypothetical protein